MKRDVLLCGVGGQGVLVLAALLAETARREGLHVRQSEVHGMAQRGGAVLAYLRISDGPIHSDLIGAGTADLIVSLEPVELFRHLEALGPEGLVVTALAPVKNVPGYPEAAALDAALAELPQVHRVDTHALARQAGNPKVANVVLAGAAIRWLPMSVATLETVVAERFAAKGEAVVAANREAVRLGREHG